MAEEVDAMSAASAGESDGGRDVSFSSAAGSKTASNKIRRRKTGPNKHPKLKRHLSKFERHYSKLQLDSTLIPEKRRIDYVLVYELAKPDSKEESKEERRNEHYRQRFEQSLKAEGFAIQSDKTEELCFVKLHCPFKRLCAEAEKIHLEMPLKGCAVREDEPRNCLTRFIRDRLETDNEDDFVSGPFFMDQVKLFQGHEDPTHFFRPALRSFLTNHILINLDIRTEEEKSGTASDGGGDAEEVDEERTCCVRSCGAWCLSSHFLERPQTKEEQNKNNRMLKKRGLPYLLMKGAYSDAFILHEDSERIKEREQDHFYHAGIKVVDDLKAEKKELASDPRKDLDETWTHPFKYQPLWKIRNYFGEKIAFYFAWSGMLISTLWIPTFFGIGVFFYGLAVSIMSDGNSNSTTTSNATSSFIDDLKGTVDDVLSAIKSSFDNIVTPYFALVICLWGTVFLEVWKRKNATLAYEWDVDAYETHEPDRPQFFGTRVKKDPVTDEDMWFYPFKRQLLKYFASASVLIFMVCLVIISVVMIIVYRIIMSVDYCPSMSSSACLVVATVSSSLLNAVSILLLGKIYDLLAVCLTQWENHRTQTMFDDSLIIKLFAFQFVNSYSSLFYIAFFRSWFDAQGFLGGSSPTEKYRDSCSGTCMSQLSFQVLVLMLAKPFPKFLKDVILPWLKRLWRRRPACCCRKQNQVEEGMEKKRHINEYVAFLDRERLKPDLQDFTLSEYTEKVIQYGFLMLFAAAFPLAPLLALLTLLIDIRVDAKRMLWWYRRPVAYMAQDIGKWYDILTFVNFVGVLTNAFIIAFTSSWGQTFSLSGKLWIVVGFEHIVFLLKYILAYLIPDVPNEVTMAIRREKYQVHQLIEGAKERTSVDYAHLIPATEGGGHVLPDTKEEGEDDENKWYPPAGDLRRENSRRTSVGYMTETTPGSQRYSSMCSDKVSVSAIKAEEKDHPSHGNHRDEERGGEWEEAERPHKRDRSSTHRLGNGRATPDVIKRKPLSKSREDYSERRDGGGKKEKESVFIMNFKQETHIS